VSYFLVGLVMADPYNANSPILESVFFEDITQEVATSNRSKDDTLQNAFVESSPPLKPSSSKSRLSSVDKENVNMMKQTPAIDITVTDPEKFGEGMNAFITYKVKTTTTLPQFQRPSFIVARRYNDFVWLHDQLREHNKGYLIPPLPEKGIISRFSADFIETRRRDLEKFLNRVAQHRVLHTRPEFILFLEAPDEQFVMAKTQITTASPSRTEPAESAAPQASGGFGSSLVSFLGQGLSAVSSLTSSVVGGLKEIDQWFDAKKGYINALETHLIGLSRSTNQLIKRRRDLALGMADISSAASLVGSQEADNDSLISDSFIRIAQVAENIHILDESLCKHEGMYFEDALRDYIRTLGAVKDMLADRDVVLLEYQNATRNLETKRDRKTKVKNIEREVEDAMKRVDETKREYEQISRVCRQELEIFDTTRAREIKRMMGLLVQVNLEHSLQVVDLWKTLISDAHTSHADDQDWKGLSDRVCWGSGASLH
jgi:sorting nexin-1/2